MKRVPLGRTGIDVSVLGIGTGTANPSGGCAQALMEKEKLASLLLFAYENGINFWDAALQYKTYPHIRIALEGVKREEIVLTTKLPTSGFNETLRDFNTSLKEVGTDYFDICLMHGLRTRTEFKRRAGALDALIRLKEEGKVCAIGISSHGMSALKHTLAIPEIDVVWARVNFAGLHMDRTSLGLYDRLASVPLIKRYANILPDSIKSAVRPGHHSAPAPTKDRQDVEETLTKIHAQSKGIVGMKVLAEGELGTDVEKAVGYIRRLSFVDSFIIGMLSRKEIEENCRLSNRKAP